MIQLRPNSEMLAKLKSPLGQLLRGTPEETIPELKALIRQEKPPMVVAVGDVVSTETLKAGVRVDLRIVDQKTLRKPTASTNFSSRTTFRVKNPPGVITLDAWTAIKDAMKKRGAAILVDGEEDLLALPVIVESPENAFVLYGQPSQGMVVVIANRSKKREIVELMHSMSHEEVRPEIDSSGARLF